MIKLLVACALFAGMAVLSSLGFSANSENKVRSIGFAVTERPASGQLHIIEMDGASVAAIERWPWERGHYANVVDQLHEAGVRSITFDVDFSSPSDPAEDASLAAALERADGMVALPTFAQLANHGALRQIDSLPIPELRSNASLASVSVLPDPDGLVRRMPLGTMTAETPRPSLAAHIAHRSGQAGVNFPIDFSIDPDTIPRHSFIAIERGHFDRQELAGKDVIIGATAVELNDSHVVPRFGILPGVVVHALAAETLYAGVPIAGGWVIALCLAFLFTMWVLSARAIDKTLLRGAFAMGCVLLVAWLTWSVFQTALEIVPALGAIGLAAGLQALNLFRKENHAKRLTDSESGLPNQRALGTNPAGHHGGFTIAAMVGGFDAIKSVLDDDQIGPFMARLAERMSVCLGGVTIYRIEHRVLAWTSDLEHYDLESCLSGLNAIMRSPIEVGGRRLDVSLGIGIAENGTPAEASLAAIQALRSGDVWRYHQASERAALEDQLSLMGELDAAIERKELGVHYQPKLDLVSGAVTSVEALVRWQHPERGRLSPDTFVPMAEESGRISNMTLYVLEQVIADLKQWNAQGVTLSAAVNISARLVSSESFISDAIDVLRAADIAPEQLIFEVTESASLDDKKSAIDALERLRDLGVSISMDDYGTGQSTLSYLKTLPLAELKIDRSFVQFADREKNDGLLVRSTVNLAHQLGLRVVAEGVENIECLNFLKEIGCDYAQGYYVSRPLEATKLLEFVQAGFAMPEPQPNSGTDLVAVAA